MISTNEIYTNLCNSINTTQRPVYCTRFYSEICKETPCLFFRESHRNTEEATTLNLTDKQVESTVEIEIYSEDSSQEIMSEVETAMRSMMFIEQECHAIENADPTIERMYGRFYRVIAGGDEL